MQGYYRSGTAARILGISSYHFRRLCETGLVRGERLPSGQWRVPVSEIERLQREPIPPIPQGLLDEEEDLSEEENGEPEDEDPVGSERSVGTNAKVGESADEIAIARNQFVKRKIDFPREQLEDRFRARDKEAADQRAARMLSARQQLDQESEARRQRTWRDDWLDYALQSLPIDCPPEVRLGLLDLVDGTLSKTDYHHAQHVAQSLVDAALARALEPHRRRQAVDRVIKEAVDRLPPEAKDPLCPPQWQLRATADAQEAVRHLPKDASLEEVELAARQAVDLVIREFAHKRTCERIVAQLAIPGATSDELEEVRETLRLRLASLSVGASMEQFKKVILEVLSPVCERIDLRKDQALRQEVIQRCSFPPGFPNAEVEPALRAVTVAIAQLAQGTPRHQLEQARDRALQPFLAAHKTRQNKAQHVEKGVNEVSHILLLLSIEGKFRENLFTVGAKLKDRIRKHLEMQLTGNESWGEVRKLVEDLIHQELGLKLKTS